MERLARDPHRTVRVVEIGVPSCQDFPGGTNLYVHPKQVKWHLKKYRGAYVVQELSRKMTRGANSSGITPKGHVRDHRDFAPGAIVTR